MLTSMSRFEHDLLRRLLAVAALTVPLVSPHVLGGCGGDVAEDPGTGGASSQPSVVCFDWPNPAHEGCTSGMGGAAGAGGTAGGTGGAEIPACPSASVARDMLCGEVNQISEPPTFENGQCCYPGSWGAGRPFILDGAACVAEPLEGPSDWAAASSPSLDGLDVEARRRMAEAWATDGCLEQASVAAFSRLSLELLAFGAPPDLVADVHAAALDEIRHARLCFGLASAYAGRPMSPGALPIGGSVPIATDLAVLAASTVVEGCIGETVAAVDAAARLERAADPAVSRALEVIARDEARHAELAWRVVAWAMTRGGAEVHAAVRAAFEAAIARRPTSDVHASAMRNVIEPAARALL